MTQSKLAKALGLSTGYVSKLCREGMPKDLEQAKTWLELRKSGRKKVLPWTRSKSGPVKDPADPQSDPAKRAGSRAGSSGSAAGSEAGSAGSEAGSVAALTAGSLSRKIERHRQLLTRAADQYEEAINAGDPSQGKLQSAYNALFNRLIALEDEEKRRAVEAGEWIRLTEAQEIIGKWTSKVVARLDKLPLDCAESCNPDRPETAIKTLEKWLITVRQELAT